MRILLLATYFEPENVSSSLIALDRYEAFANEGFEMVVYAPLPTRGVTKNIRKKYFKNKYTEKHNGKMKIYRFYMFGEGNNIVLRAIRYLLCNIVHFIKGISAKRIDAILVSSTPPTKSFLAVILKKIKKIPTIYVVQDLFPDSLVNIGLIKKGSFIWKIASLIERYTYKNVNKIIVISEDMRQNIISNGIDNNKVEVIYNWVNERELIPIKRSENFLFEKFNLNRDYFYVVYAGNLGRAQNIEVIIETANKLKNYKDIIFLLFGSGQQESFYKEMSLEMNLHNVKFLPLQPLNLVPYVYSLGDVSIVSCKEGFGKSAMPSKTWSIMSTGTAVIANFDEGTELQNIIERNNAGIFTKSGDVIGLKNAILKLYKDRDLCREMGDNGRTFILNNLTKEVGTRKYVDIIKEMVG